MSNSSHNHKCDECSCIWHHDPDTIPDDHDAHTIAHTCPECGAQQYGKLLTGSGTPEYCSNGVRCIKLDGSGSICKPAPTKPLTPSQLSEREQRSEFMNLIASLLFTEQGITQ